MDAGLPGYSVMAEEDYYTQSNFDLNSYSSMMLVFTAAVAAVFVAR
jgi:hypothetical protein